MSVPVDPVSIVPAPIHSSAAVNPLTLFAQAKMTDLIVRIGGWLVIGYLIMTEIPLLRQSVQDLNITMVRLIERQQAFEERQLELLRSIGIKIETRKPINPS